LPTPKKAELLRQAGLYVCTRKEHSECMREDVAEDPGSEVDFGSSSDHDAATPAASPVLVQPNLHRRRLATKTQPPRFVREGMLALLPKPLDTSCLGLQLGTIFSIDWGSAKPLVALVGKESGIVYCGSKPLNCSVSAMHLLTAAADAQTAYSRLLLSPSTRRELPPRLRVWLVEDIIYNGEKTTDGSSDIGLDDAVRLGMITLPKNVPSLVLYSPIQMRTERALNSRQHCLGKGMLMVDPTSLRLDIYVTKDTVAAMKPPCVNAQLAVALLMRAMRGKTAGARECTMGQLI
ncbi:unnamed protein product, partial [Symbiodinium sp. CCMP2456]